MAVNKYVYDKIISSSNNGKIETKSLNSSHYVVVWEDKSASITTLKTTFWNHITKSNTAITTITSPISGFSMYDPKVTLDGKGGYVFCWTQDGSYPVWNVISYKYYSDKDSFCNAYNIQNQLISTQRIILNNDKDYQYDSSVSAISDSKVAVVWSSKDIIGGSDTRVNINYATYNPKATSSVLSSSLVIASGTIGNPYISSASNGMSIVTYVDNGSSLSILKGRIYQNNIASGNVFSISSSCTASEQSHVTFETGYHLVSWTCTYNDNYKKDIYSNVYDSSGRLAKVTTIVNSNKNGNQYNPKIIIGSDNSTGLFWLSDNNIGLYFRSFDQKTNLFGRECKIIDIPGDISKFTYSVDFNAYNGIIAVTNSLGAAKVFAYNTSLNNLCDFSHSSTATLTVTLPPSIRSVSPSVSYTKNNTESLSWTTTGTESKTGTVSSTWTGSKSTTESASRTDTKSNSGTTSNTVTDSHSITGTSSRTESASKTSTDSHSLTATPSKTGTKSNSGTISNTATDSHSITGTSSNTGSASITATDSHSLTATPSKTGSVSKTGTDSHSLTDTPSKTETKSNSGTISNTATDSHSITGTSSNTGSASITVTDSHSLTATPSKTETKSNSGTISNTATDSNSITGTLSNTGSASNSGTVTVTDAITLSESVSGSLTNSKTESKDTKSATQSHELTQSTSISLGCNEVLREVGPVVLTYDSFSTYGDPIIDTTNQYSLFESSIFRNDYLQSMRFTYDHQVANSKGLGVNNHNDDLRDNFYIEDGKVRYSGDCAGIQISSLPRKNNGAEQSYGFYTTTRANIDCVDPSITTNRGEISVDPGREIKVTTKVIYNRDVSVSAHARVKLSGQDKFGNVLVGDALLTAGYCILKDASPQGPLNVTVLNNNKELVAIVNKTLYFDQKSSVQTVVTHTSEQLPPADIGIIAVLSDTACTERSDTTELFYHYKNNNNKKYGSIEAKISENPGQAQICTNIEGIQSLFNITKVANVHGMSVNVQCADNNIKCISNPQLSKLSYDLLSTKGVICSVMDIGNTHNSVLVPGQCTNTYISGRMIGSDCTSMITLHFSSRLATGEPECGDSLWSRKDKIAPNLPWEINQNNECSLIAKIDGDLNLSQILVGNAATNTEDCMAN